MVNRTRLRLSSQAHYKYQYPSINSIKHPSIPAELLPHYIGWVEAAFHASHLVDDKRLQMVIVHGDPQIKKGNRFFKKPAWRQFQRKFPNQEQCLRAVMEDGCLLGVIPHPLGSIVIDVDAGPREVIPAYKTPILSMPSISGRGDHHWYIAGSQQQSNRHISPGQLTAPGMEEIACDIISQNKYVLINPEYMHLLVSIINYNTDKSQPFPFDNLFPYDLIEELQRPVRANAPEVIKPIKVDGVIHHVAFVDGLIDFTRVHKGSRNEALYHDLCRGGGRGRKLYKLKLIQSISDLLELAMQNNSQLKYPLSHAEVLKVTKNAWVKLPLECGGTPRDYYTHDSESQRRRAYIRAHKWNASRIKEHELVYRLHNEGKSIRQIATITGIPKSTIYDWVKAYNAPILSVA